MLDSKRGRLFSPSQNWYWIWNLIFKFLCLGPAPPAFSDTEQKPYATREGQEMCLTFWFCKKINWCEDHGYALPSTPLNDTGQKPLAAGRDCGTQDSALMQTSDQLTWQRSRKLPHAWDIPSVKELDFRMGVIQGRRETPTVPCALMSRKQ